MPLTDDQKKQVVWVRKMDGPVSLYHTIPRPSAEYRTMNRGDAEALNLKLCDRCPHDG